MRLIDADKIRWVDLDYSIIPHTPFLVSFKEEVDKLPIIIEFDNPITSVKVRDVEYVPVQHGWWMHKRLVNTTGGSYEVVRCSVCNWQHPMSETHYCPNCGSKMDGERKDNETD